MLPHILYSKATFNDEAAVTKLHTLVYEDDPTKPQSEIADEVRTALKDQLVWVAKINNQVIGYVLCNFCDSTHTYFPNSIFINGLLVLSDYRKKGIGRKLIETVLHEHYPTQYTYFSFTYDPASTHLTQFYTSCGFIQKGTTKAGNIILTKPVTQ